MKFLRFLGFILTLLSLVHGQAEDVNFWSITPDEAASVVESCVHKYSTAEMQQEIQERYSRHLVLDDLTSTSRLNRGFLLYPKYSSVVIDGYKIKNFTQAQLEDLDLLTIPYRSANYEERVNIWNAKYHERNTGVFSQSNLNYFYSVDQVGETLYIDRICQTNCDPSIDLKDRLKKYQSDEICENISCALAQIFGQDKAIYHLWLLKKFGLITTSLSAPRADPNGLTQENFEALSFATQLLPLHLVKIVFEPNPFYRYDRQAVSTLPRPTVADSLGAIYNPIDKYSVDVQAQVLFHEMGHRSSWDPKNRSYKDQSADWLAALKVDPNVQVSKYGATDQYEDFAETFVLYRFNPRHLLELSPSRYEYMKNNIFANIEYINSRCSGQVEKP